MLAVQKVVLDAAAGRLPGAGSRERRTQAHMQSSPSSTQMQIRDTSSRTITAPTSGVVELEDDITATADSKKHTTSKRNAF